MEVTVEDHSVVIFIGSRSAGRMQHLERLRRQIPRRYTALRTITTRSEPRDNDAAWYVRMTKEAAFAAYSIDQMLTLFEEGGARYFIVRKHLDTAFATMQTPLVGMTPEGFERLIMRRRSYDTVHFSAIFLQPEADIFRETLMQSQGLNSAQAEDETSLAVRLSTIPPSAGSLSSSIIPVPITGSNHDAALVDTALRQLVSP